MFMISGARGNVTGLLNPLFLTGAAKLLKMNQEKNKDDFGVFSFGKYKTPKPLIFEKDACRQTIDN